ncbi:MAG: protein translocase subunit SecD, partial [Alphaproteobacteria bacterium]|nr:protein translocase subunit SecD [Alphaproteobacteria bacterium]
MTNIPLWKSILIIAVALLGFIYAAPNVMSSETRESLQARFPSWLPVKAVNLGLDLRGGAHLLYEVDVDGVFRERSDLLVQDLRSELRQEKIAYKGIGAMPRGVRVSVTDAANAEKARGIVRKLDPNLDVSMNADGVTIEAIMNEVAIRQIDDQTISQSIEIVRRRI